VGHPLKTDQRVRLALWYTSTLAAVAAPIVIAWPSVLPARLLERFEGMSSAGGAGALVIALLGFGAVALLHYLLLSLFTPGTGRGGARPLKSPA
jgi:hypothetical protein